MIQQTIGVLRESLERELVGMRLGGFAKADLIDHAKAFPREAARRRLPVGTGEVLAVQQDDRVAVEALGRPEYVYLCIVCGREFAHIRSNSHLGKPTTTLEVIRAVADQVGLSVAVTERA
jgi:hypothetical protein